MPIYNYKCQNDQCKEEVEYFHRTHNEPLLTKCSKCGGELKRVPQLSSFKFSPNKVIRRM